MLCPLFRVATVQQKPLHHLYCSIYRHDSLQQEVKIALVGKYTKLEDAYISVIKALQHAAFSCRHKLSLIVSYTCIGRKIMW